MKVKGRNFVKIQLIEGESQAVLNILTKHYFQVALQKMAEALGTLHTRGRGLHRE
jgi:hypothetical protein